MQRYLNTDTPKMPLTDAKLRSAKADEKLYKLPDSDDFYRSRGSWNPTFTPTTGRCCSCRMAGRQCKISSNGIRR